ncbi:MAG: ABC transporter permease [Ruminococcaceae bacterium]|nr:ABC transporter permease [Oscillospiraceae bacterium]
MTLKYVIKRNVKLFFKDKGVFFTSLITPVILLVLYATFLANVYKDSFASALTESVKLSEKLINGLVGGQLISSILAVSCVTVPFCSNMIAVQDKANGTVKDLSITPVKGSVLALGYYLSTFISSLIICFAGMGICLVYIGATGWYMTISQILLLALDVFLLVMFGTALSSIVGYFLSSQGQISAVGTIVSSGYGFICGAYMPISQFSPFLQKVISFLPGTYGTSLVRNHAMQGALSEIEKQGVPSEAMNELMNVVDCNLYFFDEKVSISSMYAILGITIACLVFIYTVMNYKKTAKRG